MGAGAWSNFLVAEAGAAAALTGLIFVAVSINLAKILEFPGVSGRAGEALVLLLGVLLICSVTLVPNQPNKALGGELLGIGFGSWAFVTTAHAASGSSRIICGGGLPRESRCANWR